MQALVDVEFEGIVIPDHIPSVGVIPGAQPQPGGRGNPGQFRPSPGLAYLLGSMNAMLKAAQSHKRTGVGLYFTAIVTPGWLLRDATALPIETVSGIEAPARTVGGTIALICTRPATAPGDDPA